MTMTARRLTLSIGAFAVLILIFGANPVLAQDGRLKIHVTPKQAYAFVDGHAAGEAARRRFDLSPGDHKIDLYNYGYKSASRTVSIVAGRTSTLDVTLDADPGNVAGPWGAITIEGADRDAVLLNGKTPEYFVGHGDEFKPDAHLILEGHADLRGSKEYNKSLSERRVGLTKDFLIKQSVSEAAIETRAFGEQKNLNAEQVKGLIDQNPDLAATERQKLLHNLQTIVLANNRRVDVTLSSTGQQSLRFYPFNAKDSLALIGEKGKKHGK